MSVRYSYPNEPQYKGLRLLEKAIYLFGRDLYKAAQTAVAAARQLSNDKDMLIARVLQAESERDEWKNRAMAAELAADMERAAVEELQQRVKELLP